MKSKSVKGDKGCIVSETSVSTIVFLWLYHEQAYFLCCTKIVHIVEFWMLDTIWMLNTMLGMYLQDLCNHRTLFCKNYISMLSRDQTTRNKKLNFSEKLISW